MSPGTRNGTRSRLSGIEGVRALAALAVLAYHVWLYSAPGGHEISLGYVGDKVGSNLFVGVTLFFVLSGFLLYRPYAASAIRGGPAPAWRRYLSNRALRILPAYWVVLLVVALLLKPVLAARPQQLAANWFFLQNYIPGYMPTRNGGVGIVPAWSLANEVVFYLLLPLLGAWALTLWRDWRLHPVAAALAPAVLLLAVGVISMLAVGPSPEGFHQVWRAGFLPHAGWFGIGMALAVVRVLWEDGRFVTHRRWPLLAVLASGALVIPALGLNTRGSIDQLEYEYVLALCCGLLLSIVVLPGKRSRTVTTLSSRPLTAIGLASYSIFLWHDPLLRALRDAGATRGGGAGAFLFNLLLVAGVTGVASAATYLLVEKPALARKRPWQAGQPARVDRRATVLEQLEACATRVAGARRPEIEIAAPPELSLHMDSKVFERIAEELLNNALAYGAPPIQITASSDADCVLLAVRDHGRGVSPAFVPRLFEPFTRSDASRRQRAAGQGLGLATARKHADEHGGHLRYIDESPGALFLLDLPPTLALAAATPPHQNTDGNIAPTLPAGAHALRGLDVSSRRSRLALAATAIATAVALIGAGSALAAPTPLPTSIAALGDSLTRAWGAAGAAADDPAASWSTGTDTAVDSHYARLLRRTAAILGNMFNDAVSGTKMADTYAQAGEAVAQGADYVTILSGTNDVCTATTAQMTSAADFAGQLRATLSRLAEGQPDARILVVSIPNWYALWQNFHTTPAAVQAWASSGVCPALLGGSATDADRQAVAQRIADLNTAAASVCAEFSSCATDSGAAYSLDIAAGDLAFDWFHLSSSGQARLAAATWAVGPFAVPPPLDAFAAAPGPGTLTLTWTLPNDVARVVIVQKQGSPPAGPDDGTTVYDGSGAEGSHIVTGLTVGATYYYAAWTYDVDGVAGEVVRAAVGPPANTTLPSVTGNATVGQTLTASGPGVWTGAPPIAYAYQWQSSADGSTGWTNIAGATGTSYAIAAASVGNYLRLQVTASNGAGNASANSTALGPIVASSDGGGGGDSSGGGGGGGGGSGGGGGGGSSGGGGGGGSSGGGGGGSGVADLRLEGTVDPVQAGVGDTVTWRITVDDYNTGPATGLWVDIQLPSSVSLVSSYADRGAGCTVFGDGKLHCYLDWLADNAQFAHVILVTKVTATGDHVLTAVTGYSSADPNPADNSLTLTGTTPVPVAPAPTPVVPKPSIRIVQATTAKSGIVTLKVAIKGWTLAKQAKRAAGSSGYWVIYVDGKRNAISRSATTGTTTKLAPGQHRIRAELVGGNGKPLNPPTMSNTVVVRVSRRTTSEHGHGRA